MRTYDSSRFGVGGRGSLGSPGSLRTPIKPNPHVGGGDRMITKKNKLEYYIGLDVEFLGG